MNKNNFARLNGLDSPSRDLIPDPDPERATLRDILENGDGAIALICGSTCQHDLLHCHASIFSRLLRRRRVGTSDRSTVFCEEWTLDDDVKFLYRRQAEVSGKFGFGVGRALSAGRWQHCHQQHSKDDQVLAKSAHCSISPGM
jgi:hypothetical protein